MKLHVQGITQKVISLFREAYGLLHARSQHHEIVAVAEIVPHTHVLFDMPVEFMEIDVRKKLTRQVSKGEANARKDRKALDNHAEQGEHLLISYLAGEQPHEYRMVNRRKELPHVAFHRVDGRSAVASRATEKGTKPCNRGMRTFVYTARVAIKNKPFFKNRLDDIDDRLMHNAILHDCFVNRTLFGVVNGERFVRVMPIAAGHQIIAELKKVVFERFFKSHDVRAFTLAGFEKLPSAKQVLNRGQTVE